LVKNYSYPYFAGLPSCGTRIEYRQWKSGGINALEAQQLRMRSESKTGIVETPG
jgi:hypothetical protein